MRLPGKWEWHLAAPLYDQPALLASICDEDELTFEEEANPDELGACAVHIEWQEPFSIEHVQIEEPPMCHHCRAILEPVFDDASDRQLRGALRIAFHGGYGMFVDNTANTFRVGAPKPDYEAVICERCAEDLCHAVPWIGALLSAW